MLGELDDEGAWVTASCLAPVPLRGGPLGGSLPFWPRHPAGGPC